MGNIHKQIKYYFGFSPWMQNEELELTAFFFFFFWITTNKYFCSLESDRMVNQIEIYTSWYVIYVVGESEERDAFSLEEKGLYVSKLVHLDNWNQLWWGLKNYNSIDYLVSVNFLQASMNVNVYFSFTFSFVLFSFFFFFCFFVLWKSAFKSGAISPY